jgi:UDP-4-amino-4,6-dideoxy-N-acetyl-beta-L-altrosamine transaminase
MRMIPYGRQNINEADIQAVVDVLRSDFITQGPAVPAFENVVASYCGASHAVAVNSATSALHIACLALGVGKGDIVWTSPISFVASANCALYCGAEVGFVDIDPKTYNMSIERLEIKLAEAEKNEALPKVIIPVHLSGQPCEMQQIYALSQKYGFKIIEDASHAIGAKYQNEPVGNCKYSDITVFSFHPVKIITTAEGGMALTNQPELADQMALLRSHGITRDENKMTQASDGPWFYQQVDLGFNYRMTDLQAALGLSQMQRLDQFIQQRHKIAERYNAMLSDVAVTTPWQHPDTYSAFHLYIIRLQLDKMSLSHKEFFIRLRGSNIGVNLHYIPIYLHPYYQKFGYHQDEYENANAYYAEAISLPIYPSLTESQQVYIYQTIKEIVLN